VPDCPWRSTARMRAESIVAVAVASLFAYENHRKLSTLMPGG
jgi:hypothetical protein